MRILISGHNYHGYRESIAKSFRKLGHSVSVSEWPNVWDTTLLQKFKLGFWRKTSRKSFERARLQVIDDIVSKYNQRVVGEIKKFDPDITLFLKGSIIQPETALEVSDHCTNILWCYDKAIYYPNVVEAGEYYDRVFVVDPSDIPDLRNYGIEAELLPFGFDSDIYSPHDTKFKRDICFVGRLYENRLRILKSVIENEALNVEIWGQQYTRKNIPKYLMYKAFTIT